MDNRIIVNRKEMVVPDGTTIEKVLEKLSYNAKVAVWVNGKQLLLADYPVYQPKDGDEIRINRIVAGG